VLTHFKNEKVGVVTLKLRLIYGGVIFIA